MKNSFAANCTFMRNPLQSQHRLSARHVHVKRFLPGLHLAVIRISVVTARSQTIRTSSGW